MISDAPQSAHRRNGAHHTSHRNGSEPSLSSSSLSETPDPLVEGRLGDRKVNRLAAFIVALREFSDGPEAHLKDGLADARYVLGELRMLHDRCRVLAEQRNGSQTISNLHHAVFKAIGKSLFNGHAVAIGCDDLGEAMLKLYDTGHADILSDLGDWLGVVEVRAHLQHNYHSAYREALRLLDPTETPSWTARLREGANLRTNHH